MEETMKLILEKLETLDNEVKSMKNEIKSANAKLDNLEEGQLNLEKGQIQLSESQKRLEKGQEEIKEHLMQLESKNANRHLEISGNLEKLARDLMAIESVTGKNLTDIALLKTVK